MRVNVYHEELTSEVQVVSVMARPGREYIGLRFFLESADALHHTAGDDDRSAVTLWVGSVDDGRQLLGDALGALRRYAGETPDG
jgi:hypothetical protein